MDIYKFIFRNNSSPLHYMDSTEFEDTLSIVRSLPHKMLLFHKFIRLISPNIQVFQISC